MQTNTIAASGQANANTRKERVALFSILASAGITVGKLVAGLLSGSLALLSEAAHALVDTGATIITYFAVRAANKPADRQHHYGHGKYESLAALAETVILFMLSGVVVVQAIEQIVEGGGQFEPTPLAFVVLLVSIAVNVNRVRSLRKVAKETGSQALAADALHFASDLAGSGLVLLGLGAAVFGFRYGDALAAIGVACFIAIAGWRLGRQTLDTLLDAAPKGASDRIAALVAQVPGVLELGELRLRSSGAESFGEITVFVSRTLSLDRAGTHQGADTPHGTGGISAHQPHRRRCAAGARQRNGARPHHADRRPAPRAGAPHYRAGHRPAHVDRPRHRSGRPHEPGRRPRPCLRV